ncbi:membrane associated secretion system protein [Vibrio sp. 10N.286.49.C2]|uniref:tight adherence pilus pseudopilin TadF n=1 Tax=unclassified Vibrio TaxID=2614977 RepID=UPI000C83819B|nr:MULTISPECIES: tight adherence pilus pseudopilin TadF [unclassified Vibrio]PMH31606.1 membrane associated secretion system protein [Vibrio sp. 10N.286.49.C2]PMH50628.1 membrane associated secretion system protein [Vibrio sp. 10N.286.49.B1]PMH82802.1 membrane associated secretion system protein [Vibrio sp. 10N.286.48.B7]
MILKTRLRAMQQGSFAIELAFVLVGLCMIFLFSTDLSHKLLVRAKLDRSSFALVNVLKERTRYFSDDNGDVLDFAVTAQDLTNMSIVASRMLNVEQSQIAIQIESLVNERSVMSLSSQRFEQLKCGGEKFENYKDLVPVEDGVSHPLYRVTLCEQHDSWFESFTNGGDPTITVTSNSIMPGR